MNAQNVDFPESVAGLTQSVFDAIVEISPRPAVSDVGPTLAPAVWTPLASNRKQRADGRRERRPYVEISHAPFAP